MVNYKNGKIYKITNNVNSKLYIGSTVRTLNKRFSDHKCGARKQYFKFPLYEEIRKIGQDNFKIELIENYECDTKDELNAREEYWRKRMKADLNKYKCYMTETERKEQTKLYNQSDKRKEAQKLYRQTDKSKKRKERYNQSEKGRLRLMPIYCECGIQSSRHHMKRHEQSDTHQERMKMIKDGEMIIIFYNI
jgi:group I intron endonuclease